MRIGKFKMILDLGIQKHFLLTIHRGLMGLIFLLFTSFLSFAQFNYPVETKVVINPPYSLYLQDYTDPGKTMAFVTLKDPSKDLYEVKVRLVIQVAGTNTRKYITLPGAELRLREPLKLNQTTRIDIGSLFNPNLLSPEIPGGKLSEGLYYVNLQIIDANLSSEVVVSNLEIGGQLAWLMLNDPPFLNFPVNGTTISPTNPQNIVFQWTPRHIQSPNSGMDTRYAFYLTEIKPGESPYQALLSNSSPLEVIEDLEFPYLNFTQLRFQLTSGKQYAWQVRAYNTGGKETFRNEGKSEAFYFSYTSPCPKPILPNVGSANSIPQVDWQAPLSGNNDNAVLGYTVLYRASGTSAAWQSFPADMTKTNVLHFTESLNMLEAGKSFDIQVKSVCNQNESEPLYAGTALIMASASCTNGPQQLSVKENPAKPEEKLLVWEAVPGATGYVVKRGPTESDLTEKLTVNPLTETAFSLPLTDAYYCVFALCGGEEKAGKAYLLKPSSNGFQGTCVTPSPIGFQAGDLNKDSTLYLEWRTANVYEGYTFKYRRKGSIMESDWKILEADKVPVEMKAQNNQTYEYQIIYSCGNKLTATSPLSYFQAQRSEGIPIDQGSGNCFPPAHTASEVTTTTTVDLSWDKVMGATGYQVAYTIAAAENWTIVTIPGNKTKTTLKDLIPNTKYRYKIRTSCDASTFSLYSDTASFHTGTTQLFSGKCPAIATFDTLNTTTEMLSFVWKADPAYTSYALLYKDVEESITNWHTANLDKASVEEDTLAISGLKPGKTYEIQIQAYCGTDKAPKSITKEYSTKPSQPTSLVEDFSCGKTSDVPSPGPCDHVPVKGKPFMAADFEIMADANGPDGNGRMVLPYMDNAMVKVKFNQVQLDAAERLCSGSVSITSVEAIPIGKDIQDATKNLMGSAINAIDAANNLLTKGQDLSQQADSYFNGGANVGSVKTGDIKPDHEGNVTTSGGVLKVDGTSVGAGPATALDSKTKILYQIDKGVITEVGTQKQELTTQKKTLDISKSSVVFSENSDAIYAFDSFHPEYQPNNVISLPYIKEYEKITTTYYVPSKFIAPKVLDKVLATFSGTGDPQKVKFYNGKGFLFKSSVDGNQFKINLVGGPASDAQEIYAMYVDKGDSTSIGKLLVPSYAQRTRKVVLIQVGGTNVEGLQKELEPLLKKTFGGINVAYAVAVDKTFNNNKTWDNGDGIVQDMGSSLISNDYQGEEKAMVKAYLAALETKSQQVDTSTAYIFVCNEVAGNSADLRGKMPHEEQFGFLFSKAQNKEIEAASLAVYAAHELGHGAHFLDHTFHEKIGLKQGGTDNLMDYAGGKKLYKYQWDQVHAPGHVWGILKKDKGGAYLSDEYYFNPSGVPFKIKTPWMGSFTLNTPIDQIEAGTFPNGTIYGWYIKDGDGKITDEYRAKIETGMFKGYYKVDNNQLTSYYNDDESFTSNYSFELGGVNKNLFIVKYTGNCQNAYYSTEYTLRGNRPTASQYQNGGIPVIPQMNNYLPIVLAKVTNLQPCSKPANNKLLGGEYNSYDDYKLVLGSNVQPLSDNDWDGAWLKSDRLNRTIRWKNAMEVITKNMWENVLRPFHQVSDYYLWAQGKAIKLGHDTRWAMGASYLVDDLGEGYESGLATTGNTTDMGERMGESILSDLNIGILNLAIKRFSNLFYGTYKNTTLKGSNAYNWDLEFVSIEQSNVAWTVYPNYNRTSELTILKEITRKEGMYGIGSEFIARSIPNFATVGSDVSNLGDRFGELARINIPLFMLWPTTHSIKKSALANPNNLPTSGFEKYLNSDGTLNNAYIKTDCELKTVMTGPSSYSQMRVCYDTFVTEVQKAHSEINLFYEANKIE